MSNIKGYYSVTSPPASGDHFNIDTQIRTVADANHLITFAKQIREVLIKRALNTPAVRGGE